MRWTGEETDAGGVGVGGAGPAQGRWRWRWRVVPSPHGFVHGCPLCLEHPQVWTKGCGPQDGLRWSRDLARKPLPCQLSSHVWDVASSRGRGSASQIPGSLFNEQRAGPGTWSYTWMQGLLFTVFIWTVSI